MVDLNSASWNRLTTWLHQVDRLRTPRRSSPVL